VCESKRARSKRETERQTTRDRARESVRARDADIDMQICTDRYRYTSLWAYIHTRIYPRPHTWRRSIRDLESFMNFGQGSAHFIATSCFRSKAVMSFLYISFLTVGVRGGGGVRRD